MEKRKTIFKQRFHGESTLVRDYDILKMLDSTNPLLKGGSIDTNGNFVLNADYWGDKIAKFFLSKEFLSTSDISMIRKENGFSYNLYNYIIGLAGAICRFKKTDAVNYVEDLPSLLVYK
jgi:hypothetical protein